MLSRFALALCAAVAAVSAGIAPQVSYRFDPPDFHGDSAQLVVHVILPEGWHIQSNAPLDSFLIPTVLRTEGKGLDFGKAIYPKPDIEEIAALGGKVALFQGAFDIRVPVTKTDRKTGADLKSVKVSLRYQACNDTQCLPPHEVEAVPAGP